MPLVTKQVYIVDDDGSICRALAILLTTYGFKVETFPSAESFFKTVFRAAKGHLILDIHLPGMDGWGMLRQLKKSGFKLPVVIISAEKNEGMKERVLKAGGVGFLQKPFSDKDLVALIN